MISIVQQIFINAEKFPLKVALTDVKNVLTYKMLAEQIICAKEVLVNKYQLKKGDAIIVSANKELTFAAVYFASHLLRLIVLPLSSDINPTRLSIIINTTKPTLSVGIATSDLAIKEAQYSEFIGYKRYKLHDVEFPLVSDEVSDVIFTTGTTGEPKGVMLSQKNILSAVKNINSFIKNRSSNVELLALPIAHSFGLGRLRCALFKAQTVVVLGSFVDIKRFYQALADYKISGFGMVPANWAIIKKMSGLKLADYAKSLRYIEIGSAPMELEDKQLLMSLLPTTRICMHYGLTEASRSTFIEFHRDKDFLNTIGKASPNTTVELFDEHGKKVKNGEEGEICVRGGTVTKGYYNLPEVNKTSFWHKYFRTGDWGVKFDNGYISLCSRKKELINVEKKLAQ